MGNHTGTDSLVGSQALVILRGSHTDTDSLVRRGRNTGSDSHAVSHTGTDSLVGSHTGTDKSCR